MNTTFSVLFKYEFGKLFPKKRAGGRTDILGRILSLLITLAVAAAFVLLLYTVADGYTEIKVNKVSDPIARGLELLNFCYAAIFLSITPLPKTWAKSLTRRKNLLAILGVPLERRAISKAPSLSISIPKIPALLVTMEASSW